MADEKTTNGTASTETKSAPTKTAASAPKTATVTKAEEPKPAPVEESVTETATQENSDKPTGIHHFDSSVGKIMADGSHVLSSYVNFDAGERLA